MRPVAAALAASLLAACAVAPPTASQPAATPAPSPSGSPSPVHEAAAAAAPPRPVAVPEVARSADPGPHPLRPEYFADPSSLATALVAAERAIHDPTTPPAQLRDAALRQQQAYRDLAAHPPWVAPVRAAVPAELRAAFEANLRATSELGAMIRPRRELPKWRIVDPPPPDELLGYYKAAQGEFGVPWQYLAAIHLVETRMGRIIGLSSAGARGPMQFMPATWAAYGEGDIDDPRDAIRAAARYLAASGAPGNMDRALWAYNHSDRYVRAVKAHAAVMMAEPRTYLAYHAWRVYYRLEGGDVILPVGWAR